MERGKLATRDALSIEMIIRRTRAVGIFPSDAAITHLVHAVLLITNKWTAYGDLTRFDGTDSPLCQES